MALFHKPTCDNLRKKNKAMTRIDNQTDDAVDSMLIYKPKKMKDASLEHLFSIAPQETGSSRRTKLILLCIGGVLAWIGIVVFVFVFIL